MESPSIPSSRSSMRSQPEQNSTVQPSSRIPFSPSFRVRILPRYRFSRETRTFLQVDERRWKIPWRFNRVVYSHRDLVDPRNAPTFCTILLVPRRRNLFYTMKYTDAMERINTLRHGGMCKIRWCTHGGYVRTEKIPTRALWSSVRSGSAVKQTHVSFSAT